MTRKSLLLVALFSLILTQATFAKESRKDSGEERNDQHEKVDTPSLTEEDKASEILGDQTLVNSAKRKVGDFIDDIGHMLLGKGVDEYIAPSGPDGGFEDKDLKTAEELRENYPPVKLDDLPQEYPPPAIKTNPVITEWAPPQRSTKRKSGRKVKSYTIAGNDVKFNSPDSSSKDVGEAEESSHVRVKRSDLGAGIPDEFEFTLEALAPFDTTAEFMTGSVIPYRLIVHANNIETDVKVEIFSELSGGSYFMVSNIRVGSIGSNIASSFDSSKVVIEYNSKFGDGRWDYATVDMGNILNDAAETTLEASSQIEIEFEMQALVHDNLVAGSTYRVSVGAMYQSETYVTVAQDDLTYVIYTPQASTADATFTITGPDTLNLGVTGVWEIEAAVHDLYSDLALDVLAPLYSTGIMSIDKIAVTSVGDNYKYSAVSFDDGSNFTRTTYENYGNYGRLNLGTIINAGYHTGDTDVARNTIKFEVSITMLDHVYNETDDYVVGFTIWKKDMDNVEIMWSAQQGVQAVNETLPDLVSSPTFTWGPSSDTVVLGGRFAVVLNMSVPSSSSARYTLEASVPVNDSKAMMEIEEVRISRMGFNLPHVRIWEQNAPDVYMERTDATSVDFISWDLGIITNTGQKSGTDDQIIQFEIMIKILNDATDYYSEGNNMYISMGMKHADEYYWVGRTGITYTEEAIQYSGDQLPEFSFVNVMGSDALIYPDSAAVYDLDIIVPAGVDYPDFVMEISTTNFTAESTTKLRIISMELVYTGKAIYCEGVMPVNFTYFAEELDRADRDIHTVALLQIDRVTSLRDENFPRYSFEDSTLRIRTVVVARSSNAADLIAETVYWTEATVSFADSYIYAARAGVQYNTSAPDVYAVSDGVTPWQPVQLFEHMEGGSSSVAPGTPIVYNVTVGLPYRTSASVYVDIRESAGVEAIQICRVRYLGAGKAIAYYESPIYEGDTVNATDTIHRDIASHYKSMVSSFGYGYYVGDVTDSYLSYEVVVLLNEKANIGTSYTFKGEVTVLSDTYKQDLTLSIDATDVAPASSGLPAVYIGKLTNKTDLINIGGSELYYLDIYVVPGTQHYMVVNIFAPWNETYYGEYEILEAYVVSHGINLACYDNPLTKINITRSSDNNSGKDNVAVITLGHVPSIAQPGSELEIEANKLRIVAHVALSRDTTLAPGDMIPIAGTMDINEEHMWVGYIDSEIAASSNAESEEAGNITLTIMAHSEENLYKIGDTQHYTGLLTVPPGTAYADFNIDINSQIDSGESRIKVFDVNYIGSGMNLLELHRDIVITPTDNSFGVQHMQGLDFKFIRNTNISGISNYIEPVTVSSAPNVFLDNELLFNFSIQLLDTIELIDGFEFDIDAFITPGANSIVQSTGNTTIKVVAPPEDNAVFDWSVSIDYEPSTVYQDSTITFYLEVSLAESAKRFPSDVIMHFRVPHFSSLNSVYNKSVLTSQFTEPSQVAQYGLDFSWTKIRWENHNYMRFNITVDPTFTMEPGLGNRLVSIPVDISYKRENRTDPGAFDDWYTEMRVLTFNIEIPENYDALGMTDGGIADCQITASSDDGTNTPEKARYENDGWSMSENRGPPLYQNEYIQVDMGAYVKFTGVTIFPFNNTGFSRVNSFKIMYSRKGIRWDYALDNNRDVKTFSVSWPSDLNATTGVRVDFGISSFIAQYIRIIPQTNSDSSYTSKMRFELNGYGYPYGITLPAYTCPSGGPTLKPYELRQILAVPETNEMYACTIAEPGKMPFCSGTDDFGTSWFAMDDNLLNVYGYDSNAVALYGLARDRNACLRSKDLGHSWKAIACSIYDGVKDGATFTESKEIPFPLDGADSGTLFTNYGVEIDETHSWSVSEKALHGYPTNAAGVAGKSADENHVAYWGNKAWAGP